jgi:hypothetical protein
MYITDTHVDMTGLAEVKRVVHHFSMDTGFITSITPDLISVIDDNQGISLATWTNAAAVSAMGFMLGLKVANTMWRRLWTGPAMATFRKLGAKAVNALIVKAIGKAAGADEIQLKELEKVSDDIVAWFKKNLQNADVANDVSWKKSLNDLNGILHKSNTTYAKVADELFPKLSKHFTKFKDTIMEKGGVAKTIDKWWDSVECLREGKIFTKSSGLWSSLANKVFSATSKLTKFTAKVGGGTVAAAIRKTSAFVSKLGVTGLSIVGGLAIDATITFITSALIERYTRYLDARQALTILPLKYRGDDFVAGIKGHKGLVAGEAPSAWDKFLSGTGFTSGGVNVIYEMLGITPKDYYTSTEDATNDALGE